MLSKGDFHIHSTASDGELTPSEIVLAAKERGIDTIAIADHNTTNGINEAAKFGKQYGISVIPAIELSTRYHHKSIHLLGYFRNMMYTNCTFEEILKLVKTHRIKKARNILRNIISTESSGEYLSVNEGLYLLRFFNAAVVLAHPMRINQKYIKEILNIPFDGIEAKYCKSSYKETSFFINIALLNFSFYTGGSDFHTNNKKDINHSLIGEPFLNSSEIKIFLKKSGAILLS